MSKISKIRPIAFYLPQFYPNAQNDKWWGKGFTEWTNVASSSPLFKNHYQPHLPADLGFYDLRLPEIRQEQVNLAQYYGIEGFCYYHYWFHGERILDRVFSELLATGKPDFPFCLCWANETWSRRWWGDYAEKEVLIEQTYSDEDDLNHIHFLIKAFKDPRYIKVNGRPLFLIYRTDALKDRLDKMLRIWKKELEKVNLPDLYLCSVRTPPVNGFEASVNFFPGSSKHSETSSIFKQFKEKLTKLLFRVENKHRVYNYSQVVEELMSQPYPDYKSFYCPVPSWDNTARRKNWGALIFDNSTPQIFEKWVKFSVKETLKRFDGDEALLFINAWNEWGEGCHLEPDQKWGHSYLQALKNALS